jgi:hypothetical protein
VSNAEITEQIIDPTFLAVLLVDNGDRAHEIRRQLHAFLTLQKYGWTKDEILTAVETGYNYSYHLSEGSKWNWKYRVDAGPMRDWLQHYYHQMRAESIGLNFEDFVAQWRKFAHRQYDESRAKMAVFCRSQRYGIDAAEVERVIVRYDAHRANIYVQLRRKNIPTDIIDRVMFGLSYSDRQYVQMREHFKYFIEACRRGATCSQLQHALEHDISIEEIALDLRAEQRK